MRRLFRATFLLEHKGQIFQREHPNELVVLLLRDPLANAAAFSAENVRHPT